MIKKYLIDILCMILVGGTAILMVERPAINLNQPPSLPDKQLPTETAQETTKKGEARIERYVSTSDALKERNIFSSSGSYTLSKTGSTSALLEDSYTLIGILKGEQNKAVFKDHTGSIVALVVGEKLRDGSVVKRIDGLSVELEKGKEKRELKLFDLTDSKRRVPSKPEIRAGTIPGVPEKAEQRIRQRPERSSRERKEPPGGMRE